MSGGKPIIRDARPEELDAVAALLRESYAEYRELMPASSWEFYIQDITDVRSRLGAAELIVAETGGRLAGTVTLYLKRSGAEETWHPGWAGIRLLAVHPAYRNRGIGRALMDECIRRCRAAGMRTIGLHTTEIMAVARGMYERMGFRRAPEFDFYPAPGVVVMAYRLDI